MNPPFPHSRTRRLAGAPPKGNKGQARGGGSPPPPASKAAPRSYGPEVERLKGVCAQATIKVPPAVYRGRDEATVRANLESLLQRHGLGLRPSEAEVKRVKARLKKERELDGIDVGNIIGRGGGGGGGEADEGEGGGRGGRPRRAAAAAAQAR